MQCERCASNVRRSSLFAPVRGSRTGRGRRAKRACTRHRGRSMCKSSRAELWLSKGWCAACIVSSVSAETLYSDQRPHGQTVSL